MTFFSAKFFIYMLPTPSDFRDDFLIRIVEFMVPWLYLVISVHQCVNHEDILNWMEKRTKIKLTISAQDPFNFDVDLGHGSALEKN